MISLHTLQSLVGRLNDIALMCPFLSAFRRNISALLANTEEDSMITIPSSAEDDLACPSPVNRQALIFITRSLLSTLPLHRAKMRTLTMPQALVALDLTKTATSSFHAATYGINSESKQSVQETQADRSTSWV
jgi:hypothetical protein